MLRLAFPQPPAGQANRHFNLRTILWWVVNAFFQCGVICVFVMVGCSSATADRANGTAYRCVAVRFVRSGLLSFPCAGSQLRCCGLFYYVSAAPRIALVSLQLATIAIDAFGMASVADPHHC